MSNDDEYIMNLTPGILFGIFRQEPFSKSSVSSSKPPHVAPTV